MRDTIAFLDFETTGLSADNGDRPTEVAVVVVQSQIIVDRFQSLMNPGRRIPAEVVGLTGITNLMVSNAPSPAEVMRELHDRVRNIPIVAHNASFDRKFLEKELGHIGKQHTQEIICSMRVARRVFSNAPNHKLGTLARYAGVEFSGRAHRAMADAEVTARLWIEMEKKLERDFDIPYVPLDLMGRIQGIKISEAQRHISSFIQEYDFDRKQVS